ncbi:MAG: hypothetical protein IJ106_09680 [Parasporobacterium sp.]|nr:hypothetical protein [Parasporobacterium sp.]
MKLLGNHIPVFAKMTGIVNDDYFQDGPNGLMEASIDEVNGGIGMLQTRKSRAAEVNTARSLFIVL